MTTKKKNVRKADAESPPLPDDVIREILSFLPVKSLLRFTCVCKSWKLIISNPQFVKLHLRRSSANMADFTHIQLLSEVCNDFDDEDFESQGHLYYATPGFTLLGTCNGMISFIKWKYTLEYTPRTCWICFWNPTTKLWSRVSPPLSFHDKQHPSYKTFGFRYDGVNDTYKVVVAYAEEHQQSVVNVYDMGGSCWRRIQSFPDGVPNEVSVNHWTRPQEGVYVGDTLNWVFKLNTHLSAIVSLDLVTEKQSQMSLPYFSPSSKYLKLILGALKDSLCVLHNVDGRRFVIWHMKEFGAHESWIQLFNFDFKIHLINPFGFVLSENDEVLMMSREEVVLYNQRDDIFKVKSGLGWDMDFSYCSVQNYVESLVSPR
ncbi:F-box/kelch-repeat protein At3g23880-like [Lotus japonicus]|uniref:F-box/kelch-repeat protein At3g23880-like n=1 Tax=Lotus japonicus TaxID=34305 RepID=UPI002585F15B|nr:F-box/kelch-repeat protein At3g23880-like [Lotus japonicus]